METLHLQQLCLLYQQSAKLSYSVCLLFVFKLKSGKLNVSVISFVFPLIGFFLLLSQQLVHIFDLVSGFVNLLSKRYDPLFSFLDVKFQFRDDVGVSLRFLLQCGVL